MPSIPPTPLTLAMRQYEKSFKVPFPMEARRANSSERLLELINRSLEQGAPVPELANSNVSDVHPMPGSED